VTAVVEYLQLVHRGEGRDGRGEEEEGFEGEEGGEEEEES